MTVFQSLKIMKGPFGYTPLRPGLPYDYWAPDRGSIWHSRFGAWTQPVLIRWRGTFYFWFLSFPLRLVTIGNKSFNGSFTGRALLLKFDLDENK